MVFRLITILRMKMVKGVSFEVIKVDENCNQLVCECFYWINICFIFTNIDSASANLAAGPALNSARVGFSSFLD